MYLVDANVILGLLVGDGLRQQRKAARFFERLTQEGSRAVVSLQVLGEVLWIAERYYELDREQFVPVIIRLLTSSRVEIMEMSKSVALNVLDEYMTSPLDFTDVYIAHVCDLGGLQLVTYDKQLARRCRVETLDRQK